MNPQVALHLLSTIAQISGTVLAIYIAVVIFILQDDTLSRLILKDGKAGTSLLLGPAFTWAFTATWAIVELLRLDLKEPYSDLFALAIVILFGVALLSILLRFWLIIRVRSSSYVPG